MGRGAVAALLSTSGCSAAASRATDGLALDTLTLGLDRALAGLEVRSGAQVEALVRDARPVVVDPERTTAVWDRSSTRPTASARGTGRRRGGPGRRVAPHRGRRAVRRRRRRVWHVVCARLSVDRSRTAFVAEPVGCPDGVTPEPVQPVGDGPAPHLDLDPPDAGELVTGSPPRRGSPGAALRPTSGARPTPAPPTTSTSPSAHRSASRTWTPCPSSSSTPAPSRAASPHRPAGAHPRRRGGARPHHPPRGEVVLAPRESASALVTWRPAQGTDGVAAQRLAVPGPAGPDPLPVRLASSAGTGVPTVDPGARVTLSRWERRGYGAGSGDDPVRPDVAPRCRPEELALTSERPDAGSGRPLPPSVRVHLTAVTPCLLVPGVSALPDDVPDAVEGPPVLLARGRRSTSSPRPPARTVRARSSWPAGGWRSRTHPERGEGLVRSS